MQGKVSYKKTHISRFLALDLLTAYLFWLFVTKTEVTGLRVNTCSFSL